MAKKKRKRVYKIMKLTDECDQKIKDGHADVRLEYGTQDWDAECIADYFFMEYYPDELNGVYDEYYRQNTCLTVWYHVRKKRIRENNRYVMTDIVEEIYIVSKRSRHGEFIEVFRTRDMDELAELFQMFNGFESVAWWIDYESFVQSFEYLWDAE